jgi:hypothetical protein
MDVALDLRREHKLAKNTNPVAELDRCNPDWRSAFPLLIEDGAAKRLLDGLVRDAAQVTLSDSSRGITIQRVFSVGLNGSWSVSSHAVVPSVLSSESCKSGWTSPEHLHTPVGVDARAQRGSNHGSAVSRKW